MQNNTSPASPEASSDALFRASSEPLFGAQNTAENQSKFVATIGLEIHAELSTKSKMFCSCKNDPDEESPNKNICPICLGNPGTLPVLNMEAIKNVLRIGVALNGTLANFTEWDRKNYFYPDIPKGYQISQYKYPLISGGTLAGIELERIHLEEDTAQSTHDTHEKSLVNFNRSGVPLMELVTKPVIHDALTAVKFAKELQLLLRYLGAGEANLEKGEMRVEANISIASPADTADGKFGTKTEVKNLNSFRAVEGAIAYEIERQTRCLEAGEKIVQETRGWDDKNSETYSQRTKESSHDYRYFPEPDIPKLLISEIPEFQIDELKRTIPDLPWSRRDMYINSFGLTPKEAEVFVGSLPLAEYFGSILTLFKADLKKIKLAVNYLLTDYIKLLKDAGDAESINSVSDTVLGQRFNPHSGVIASADFAELINMIAAGDVSSRGAKDILALMFKEKGVSPKVLAETHGLIQKSNATDLIPAIEKVISDNPTVVAEYKAGKVASLQFLIGQSMKATKGAGNPEVVRKLLVDKLSV
jgi:aspartyl-tRNA(Asn)/glutamyl-tRNA(Gln) amidotransferase subunit B